MLRIPRLVFEESPVSHEEMQSRIKQRASHLPLVGLAFGWKVLAYAYASPGALEVRIDTRQRAQSMYTMRIFSGV